MSHGLFSRWLICVPLVGGVSAEPRSLRLQIEPAQTRLRIEEQEIAADPAGGFSIKREQLPSRDNRGKVLFQFSAPGWKEQSRYWSWNDLEGSLGEVRLRPQEFSVWLLWSG